MNSQPYPPSHEKFNWLTMLKWCADNPERISRELRMELGIAAGDWPTCACGELCRKLPRHVTGSPRDAALYVFGVEFSLDVRGSYWTNAIRVFHQIEERTAHLLKQP